ncbi:MAG: hypothetical protein Q9195_000272 [Heterodermia aff. obscurata]
MIISSELKAGDTEAEERARVEDRMYVVDRDSGRSSLVNVSCSDDSDNALISGEAESSTEK